MNIKERSLRVPLLIAAGLMTLIGGYFITPALKARSGPPRLVVDNISYAAVSVRERCAGYDTCLVVKVHCEGHIPELPDRKYVGGECEMANMRVVYLQNGKERVVIPSGKRINAGFNSGGPSNSYFTIWLALHSLPVTSVPFVFKADVNELDCYNVYKDGIAASSQDFISGRTPLSYTLRSSAS